MAQHPGSVWLYEHWSEEFLPNNQWVAATSEGIVAHAEFLDDVMDQVRMRYSLEEITFAYITFDVWQ